MPSDHAVYRERTPWALWMNALLWGGLLFAACPILAGWGMARPFPDRFLLAAGILLLGALIELLVGGTTVLVSQSGLRVFLGRVPLLSKRVAYTDVRAIESVRYSPIKEFGGWGLRGSGSKQAWTSRGDRALVLHLLDGTAIYVGSDNPDRLAERVRMVAGDRLGVHD